MNPFLKTALEYIASHDLNALPSGKLVIDADNIWVVIVDSDLRTVDAARLEAHDRYIDIQVPLSGPESYGLRPRGECTRPDGAFDTENDIIFFSDPVQAVLSRNPGEPIIFYPEDAHAPLIGEGRIHKAIFKVRMAE